MRLEAIFGNMYGRIKITASKTDPDKVFLASPFKHVLEEVAKLLSASVSVVVDYKEDSAYPWRTELSRSELGLVMTMIAQSVTYESFSEKATSSLPPEILEYQAKIKAAIEAQLAQAGKTSEGGGLVN